MPRHIRPPFLAALQSALADNVRVLMDRRWPDISSKDERIKKLEAESTVSKNTIYRILDPDAQAKKGAYIYPRLDSIAILARTLDVSTIELLTPDYAARAQPSQPPPKRRNPSAA